MNLNDIEYKIKKTMYRWNLKQQLRLYRKLGGMLTMNEPLPRALDRLWVSASMNGKKPGSTQAIALKEWRASLQSGINLTDAMVGWVPGRHLMILRAGEESGAIAKGLSSIEYIETSSKKMKQVLTQAMGYPVFVLALLFGVLWMFGVNLVDPMRQMAPASVTEKISGLANVTDFVRHQGLWIIVFFGAVVASVIFSLKRWIGPIRAKIDMYVPYSWYRLWQGSAFLMGMSALLAAQTPLSRALGILEAGANDNKWLRERVGGTRQEVLRGLNLGEALEAIQMNFPDPIIVMDMIVLAERTDVSRILEIVSKEWMDDQIEVLQVQGVIVRNLGLALIGGIIGWAFTSIIGITQGISNSTQF